MTILINSTGIKGTRAEVRGRIFHNGIDDSGKPLQRSRDEVLRFDWNGNNWVRVR